MIDSVVRLRIIMALAALVVAVLVNRGAMAGQVRIGDPAPDLVLPDLAGQSHALADLRGQVAVIDFWATWCGLCGDALPALDAIARRHAGDGLRVLAVNLDRKRSLVDAFLAQRLRDGTLMVLLDPEGATLARFGAEGMPSLYVIDRSGTVRVVESGYTADRLQAVETEIVALLGAPAGTAVSGPRPPAQWPAQ